MPGLQQTVTIAAPPERVWAIVVDVERWPERIPTVDAVERLEPGPLSGISWLITRSLTKRYVETEAASIRTTAETSTTRRQPVART